MGRSTKQGDRQPAGALPNADTTAGRLAAGAVGPVEQAIVEEATANQAGGYRMVTAFVRRRPGRPVNRASGCCGSAT
jgi:hypothetical protein